MHRLRFLFPCLLLLVFLTACGSIPITTSRITQQPQHPALSTNIGNACSLVTREQVQQAVHAPVVLRPPDASNGKPLIDTCQYTLLGKSGTVNIDLHKTQDSATAQQAFAQLVPLGIAQDTQIVHALGDQAIFAQKPFPLLYVLKDNAFIAVGIVLPVDSTLYEQEETQIAQFALHKM